MIDIIGLDIDRYNDEPISKQKQNQIESKIIQYGKIHSKTKSHNGGIHYRIQLDTPLTFMSSLLLRSALGDDPARCWYDMERYLKGCPDYMLDILFDSKQKLIINTKTKAINDKS